MKSICAFQVEKKRKETEEKREVTLDVMPIKCLPEPYISDRVWSKTKIFRRARVFSFLQCREAIRMFTLALNPCL